MVWYGCESKQIKTQLFLFIILTASGFSAVRNPTDRLASLYASTPAYSTASLGLSKF